MLTVILVSLLAVSAVSAADNATDDVVSVEETTDDVVSVDEAEDVISVEENQVILSENNNVGTFDDLQSEIDNATEGSVLNLTRDYNGHYGSRIQLNKNLTIDGQGHTLDCLGEGGCSAFYSKSGIITLKNLKIINGHNDFNNKGGAIYIEGSAQYTIINCTFSNNWADDYGGAIYNGVDKPLIIINSSFDKNTADDDNGGAIYSKGELDIINSTFTSNNANDDGGAIYCEKSVSVENCLFEKNKAKVDGGAIYSKNNVNITKNTRFYSNNATGATSAQCYGGAIRSEGNVEVDHATFNNNVAGDYGGAIYANNASISSAKFESNKADDNYGGAVYVEDSVDVMSTTFSSNHAGDHGGAIYSKNRIFAKNTRFTSNYARHKGSSVRCEGDVIIEDCYSAYNWAYNQGSIAAAGDIYIKNSEFRKDRVTNFGAAVYGEKNIYVDNGYFSECHAQEKGGAIYCKNNVIAVNSRFDGNLVYYSWEEDSWSNEGGGIYCKGDVAIDNCSFIRNEAREAGGAIYADTITWGNSSSEFRDNYATYTGGGAIYVNKFNTDVKYGIFINNYIEAYKAETDGGAIYINKENHVTFSHCYFENNRCTDEGAAIYLDSTKSHLTLEYNIFINNKAKDKGNIVYNKGTYDKIHNNWYGSNSFDFSNELVEYNAWGSDKSHEDDGQVIVELSLDENPIAGQPSTVIVTFISDGELFNYGAGFRADNGAKLTNKKTGNNTVTSDIAFDDGITTVTATVNRQVLKLSYSYSKQNVTMDITAQEIIFGDNATVNVILTSDNATGKVTVGNIHSTIVNGTATLIIPDLSAGNHTLLVSYSGDGVYKAKQENVTITVNRKNLNIDASAKPIVKGDNATVIVTGLERATGNVTVTINNNNWTGKIINGTATIIIPGLNENTTANITYSGDANYINASTKVDIIVNPVKMNLTIIVSADPIMVSEDAIVVVTGLENATGNVTVTIGGVEWYGEINAGTATVIVTGLKLNATADVFYAGDYLYNNATTTVNITVTPTIFVWYVNGSKESSGNGTTPDTAFKTLKEALRKAPENSTIYIAPGTYTGENNINLTINKNNLTLVNYGAGEVIFDAQSGSRILTVNAGRINITGLTFKNGKEEYVCGAIFFNQTLKDSYINAIFINNSVVDGLGGAIGFYADVINTDINSIFINNSVNNGYGGAIFFNGNLNNVIISGNYTANTAGDYGGAILFNGDLNNVIISGNYTANTANDGGAIFFYGNLADVNISGYYNNNQANDTGGAFLFINNLTNVLISGDYINNVARFCAVCYMSEFATVNNSIISGDYYNNSAGYCVVLLMEGIISNSNISGNYANNHAIMGINILGEAYNVNMCGNYVNNNISNGSAIYIVSCDEYSLIHDSIFINNTIDDELIIDVESGSLLSVNNWFGNNASNYNIKPKVSENVTMANWLFLNATTDTTSEITVNETAEITFKLYAYNGTSEEINEYDASEMNIRLDLSQRSGTLNQTTALINETILYTCREEGIASVTGKFETVSYTIILAKQSTEIIINKTKMTLKVNETVSAGATLNPPEAVNLTYTSSNVAVAVVENGMIKCLKEGDAIITVSFAGNDEYAPAESKNITVHVEKRIPLIIASADVTDNRVTIHLDINRYEGWISMNISDSLVYLPISSSLNFTQNLTPGIYNVNITALGNDMFYSGSKILTFHVPEAEKLNTSISAQSSVNGNTVTITVDVDSNASGFVEIDIASRKYYVPVVNGTAVFINDYFGGSYVADVTYLGDENYNTNSTSGSFKVLETIKTTIIASEVTTVYNCGKYLVVSLKDQNGNILTGVSFTVEINGKNNVIKTNELGQAILSTNNLAPKTYTAKITFNGTEKYLNATKSVKVVVKKATPKLTAKAKTFKKSVKTKKYKVTLKTNKNKVMKKVKLTLKVGKKTYTAKTNNKGVAIFKITKLTKKGKYTATIKYKGSKYYKKLTKKAKITIK